jgi:hypothetical protein
MAAGERGESCATRLPDNPAKLSFAGLDIKRSMNADGSIPAAHSLSSLKGIVKKPAKPLSIDDINRIITSQGTSAQ